MRRLDLNGNRKISLSELNEALAVSNNELAEEVKEQSSKSSRVLGEQLTKSNLSGTFINSKSSISHHTSSISEIVEIKDKAVTFAPQLKENMVQKLDKKLLKKELQRTFLDNIYLEKEVEKLKIELFMQEDFTPLEAFHLILHKDCPDPDSFAQRIFDFIQTGLFDQTQSNLLFIRYAQPHIGYSEFQRMVKPMRHNVDSRPRQELSEETLEML